MVRPHTRGGQPADLGGPRRWMMDQKKRGNCDQGDAAAKRLAVIFQQLKGRLPVRGARAAPGKKGPGAGAGFYRDSAVQTPTQLRLASQMDYTLSMARKEAGELRGRNVCCKPVLMRYRLR